MPRQSAFLLFAAAALSVCASTAAAQASFDDGQGFPYRRPTRPHETVGLRAYVVFDRNAMTASQTFDAVLGTSRLGSRGGGAEVIRIWHGLFARVAGTSLKESGSRVVVFGTEAVSLGIPLSLEMQHLEFAGGWRFHDKRRSRVVGYVGGGLLRVHYIETSTFADTTENTDEFFNGVTLFGGVDLSVWKWFMVGAEAQYRGVANALGASGVSKVYKETDLGGATARVLVGIRR